MTLMMKIVSLKAMSMRIRIAVTGISFVTME